MHGNAPRKKLVLTICGLVILCACGGGGGGGGGTTSPASPPAVIVSISPSTQTNIDQGQTVKFTASVENDSSGKGVTWNASAGGTTGAAAGTFTNTSTTAATYNAPSPVSSNLSVTVTATSVADTTKSSSALVVVSPPPIITTTALANATPNASYSATLEASGGAGALTWSLAGGSLPSGLSLSSSGTITGTPTVAGTWGFGVQVTDSSGASPVSAQAQLSLTVVTAVSITTTSLPAGYQGNSYVEQLQASGGTPPYTWSLTAGSLPPGLAMQPSSGTISGTPTSQGTFQFTVAAQDSSPTRQTQTQALTITISNAMPLAITTTALTNATPNANYSATLQATGGTAPLTWSLASGALPTGLALSGTGAITGDPTVPGTFVFTVQVTDSSTAPGGPASAQAQLSITVVTVMSITTTSLPAGSAGVTYLGGISASGGTSPYTWSVLMGSLPPGLTLQPSSGAISGSPTSQGTFIFTVEAQDSSPTPQMQVESLTLAIGAPGPLAITTLSLLDGTSNQPYYARVAAIGGTPPYNWTITAGTLPTGVTLSSSTGAFSGAPPATGTTSFTVAVSDASSPPSTQEQQLSITIANPAEACASSGNNGVLSGSYAFSLSGFNNAGFLAVVGSFTADGTGKITAGEADTNGVLGAQQGNIITAASSYSVGSDNRGCASLATPFGLLVTHFALGSASSNIATGGRLIEWDSPSPGAFVASGQLLRQDLSAIAGGLSGSYAFRTVGWDPSPTGGRDACAGAVSAGGNTFSGFEEDCNDAWTISNLTASDVAGTYTSPDTNGRSTGILAAGQTNSNVTFYAVSGSQVLMLNADFGPYASGEWDQQTAPAGGSGFSQASLDGNLVLYLNGSSLVGTATTVSMGTASADGSSSMTINYYEDRAGTMQISGTYTCTYAVEPNGRVTLSSNTQSCGGAPPLFYLMGLNTGFIVDASPGVDTGSFEPQSAGPFSNASLIGAFYGGTAEVVLQGAQAETDPIAPSGTGTITGATDATTMSAQSTGAAFVATTYTANSDGSFAVSSSAGDVAGIIISGSKFVMISPSTLATSYPTLLVMQH